jgi:predicted nucleic acid-binding protein
MNSRKREASQSWLVFIDTNIFLDFYRLPGESAKRTLAALEKHKESLILTDQVWMEFLKNRQKVILQGMKQIERPGNPAMPSLLNESQVGKVFAKRQRGAREQHKKLIEVIEKILLEPARYDAVFKALSRIFDCDSSYNLKRPDKRRYEIRRSARKRFGLGYPPRKDDTLRFGDAINWEWVVKCAASSKEKANIVLVSRDDDFGSAYNGEAFLNDWLRLEFKERVSQRRKIELTNRLSSALKRLSVNANRDDVVAENKIVHDWERFRSLANTSISPELLSKLANLPPAEELRSFSDHFRRAMLRSLAPPTEDKEE